MSPMALFMALVVHRAVTAFTGPLDILPWLCHTLYALIQLLHLLVETPYRSGLLGNGSPQGCYRPF